MDHDRGVPLLAATPDDLPFLWEMLAQAAFPEGGTHPAEVLADDHLRRYLDRWGQPGDAGLVAWEDGRRAGAAWLRLLPPDRPGYGFVDPDTPEVSLAVVEASRGRGLGRELVAGALDLAAARGHQQVSLSVALTNVVAAGLYRSLGFADVAPDDGGSMTMWAPTAPAPPPEASPTLEARLATAADGPAVARLRQIMFLDFDGAGDDSWVAPLLATWPEEHSAGRWVGAVVPGVDGRPVASALAAIHLTPPGPGRTHGRSAHVGSVATEPGWRRRGAARAAVARVVAHLDEVGVESSTLSASSEGAPLYVSLGYRPGSGVPMRRPHP